MRPIRLPSVLVAALAVVLSLLVGGVAHADWTSNVAYKRQGSTCVNDGSTITIGARVLQKEFGKNGVTQLRITWLLYDVDPQAAGLKWSYARKTKESGGFPNDEKNYWWDGATGASHTFKNLSPTKEWWLTAKLTWVRAGKRDWNYKLPVAYCS